MKKLKISQIQFEAKATPVQNSILLKKYFEKTKKFKPDLICTPECSNIITNDKNHLLKNIVEYKEMPKSELEEKQTVSIPFHERLTKMDINYIIDNIRKFND